MIYLTMLMYVVGCYLAYAYYYEAEEVQEALEIGSISKTTLGVLILLWPFVNFVDLLASLYHNYKNRGDDQHDDN